MSVEAGRHDVAIVGGGIVGLATAMCLLKRFEGLRVVVLEKDREIATQQTGHNSGVLHSGVYYRPDSLKARFCVEGAAALMRFCDQHGVRYEQCGKVIVATRHDELERLQQLHERGTANGVEGLEMIGPERLRAIEPHVAGVQALWCPATGIIDFRAVAQAYAGEIRKRGGEVATGVAVQRLAAAGDETRIDAGGREYRARYVINCAGLHADRIARQLGARPELRIIPFRGEYYTLRPERTELVRGLVYPVPNPAFPFLGVHFTRGIDGAVEAGPNAVLATAREGYRKRDLRPRDVIDTVTYGGFWRMAAREWRTGLREVHRSLRKSVFVRDLQRLIPAVRARDLAPGGSGVRAQAVARDGALLDDFAIEQTERAIHVLNAPSPGATSSLMIGSHIVTLAAEAFSLG